MHSRGMISHKHTHSTYLYAKQKPDAFRARKILKNNNSSYRLQHTVHRLVGTSAIIACVPHCKTYSKYENNIKCKQRSI